MKLTRKSVSKPREVVVILGRAATRAYLQGETSTEALKSLGGTKTFRFLTQRESNAFMFGVDVAADHPTAIAVDGLQP
jgi:hypothetical protein